MAQNSGPSWEGHHLTHGTAWQHGHQHGHRDEAAAQALPPQSAPQPGRRPNSSQSQPSAVLPLEPTWHGFCNTTVDALILFEACIDCKLPHVSRRPHDKEREGLIKSGSIFIYEEESSGIKRWTDGFNWSPSRILNNYLIYREMVKPFTPGEKKKALKKKKDGPRTATTSPSPPASGLPAGIDPERIRNLVGSLTDSYPFKDQGLIKKTISVSRRGIQHHMVSYYNIDDVLSGRLRTPTNDPDLHSIIPRQELISNQSFRVPIDQEGLFVVNGRHDQLYTIGGWEEAQNQHHQAIARQMNMIDPHQQARQPHINGTGEISLQYPEASFGLHQTHMPYPGANQHHGLPSGLPATLSNSLPSQNCHPGLRENDDELQRRYSTQYEPQVTVGGGYPMSMMPMMSAHHTNQDLILDPHLNPDETNWNGQTYHNTTSNSGGSGSFPTAWNNEDLNSPFPSS